MLNGSGESGYPCLVPDFRGNAFSFSPLRIMFAFIMRVIELLLCWGMFLLFLLSGGIIFYHKWMLNFVKGFLCIYWDNHMVFIFWFVNVVYYIDWLQILKNPFIPGIKPTWSWCMIFLICCCLLVFCFGFLHLCSSVILACSFLFLWHLCLVLELGWWCPHRMSSEVNLLLKFFGRVWVR